MQSEDDLTAKLSDIFLPTLTGEILLGVGDDCAIIKSDSPNYLTSTDLLVEGSHFLTHWLAPEDIAKRTFMQNVADILAMGARPVAIVIGVVLPHGDIKTPDETSSNASSYVYVSSMQWILRFADALRDIALKERVAVVGGDIAVGEVLMLSGTVYGSLDGRQPVLRSGAKEGDVLALSGSAGLSNLGYDLLKSDIKNGRSPLEARAISRYKTPEPPFYSAKHVHDLGVNAMLDVSDGLYQDAMRIARASHVSVELFTKDAKHFGQTYERTNSETTRISTTQYYFGGEDHGLLAAFDAKTFHEATDTYGFVQIGKVHAQKEMLVFGVEIDRLEKRGWDHITHEKGRDNYV